MIIYLNLVEVLQLHQQIIEQSGGAPGIRDIGLIESSLIPELMWLYLIQRRSRSENISEYQIRTC